MIAKTNAKGNITCIMTDKNTTWTISDPNDMNKILIMAEKEYHESTWEQTVVCAAIQAAKRERKPVTITVSGKRCIDLKNVLYRAGLDYPL